jgi:hypothetical protein
MGTTRENSVEDEAGRMSPSEPWTRAEVWWLVARVAFWLVGFAVMGAFQWAFRWKMLRARLFG